MAKIHQLSKRTKLRPDQLERVKGGAGKGEASKYDENGVLSISLVQRLAKARRKAKRFVLYSDAVGRRMYVADPEKLDLKNEESLLTFDIKQALEFYFGFDNPENKVRFYTSFFSKLNIPLSLQCKPL